MSVKIRANALENFKSSVGCFFKGGALVPSYRAVVAESNMPSGITFAEYSRSAGKLFFCDGANLYVSSAEGYERICGVTCAPSITEDVSDGAARAVIIAGDTAAEISDTVKVTALPVKLSCAAMHCGRLFGADGLTLRWSGAGGYDDWKEGLDGSGYLDFDAQRGEVLDIFEFGGKLVAVREYGLTVLSMFGHAENFSVDITDTDCDKISKNTACVIGGKLYFYSASGLKCFDGTRISEMETRHSASVYEPKSAVGYEGKYFLACKSISLAADAVLCVDTRDGESCVLDEAAETLFVNDGVYFFCGGDIKNFIAGGRYSFTSKEMDFGTGRLKTVTSLEISGTADVRISSERLTRLFYDASGIVRPHMRGKRFIIEAKGKSELGGIFVTAEATDAI